MTGLSTLITMSGMISNHVYLIPQSIAIPTIVLSSISNSRIHFGFRFRLKINFENPQLLLMLFRVTSLEYGLRGSVLSHDKLFKLVDEVIWSLTEMILFDIRFCNDRSNCILNCIVCIVFTAKIGKSNAFKAH